MQFAFFYPKNIFKLFWKISLVFAENLEMTQIAGGGGGQVLYVIMTQCVRKSICDSPLIAFS